MFAKFYDALMADVDYSLIYAFYEAHKPKEHPIVIDAGCGSGNFLLELIRHGEHAYGIDKDEEMLAIALEKLKEEQLYAPLFVHDLKDPLTMKVDVITSFFDVVNYFKGTKGLFKRMYQALNTGGVYMFDCYKEDVLETYDGYIESGDDPIPYHWKITSDHHKFKHEVSFNHQIEHITQYVHPIDIIKEQLVSLGFNVFIEEGVDSRKWYVIAKKGEKI